MPVKLFNNIIPPFNLARFPMLKVGDLTGQLRVWWRASFDFGRKNGNPIGGNTTAHVILMVDMREHFLGSLMHTGLHHTIHVSITLFMFAVSFIFRQSLETEGLSQVQTQEHEAIQTSVPWPLPIL